MLYILFLSGCSEYDLNREDKVQEGNDNEDSSSNGTTSIPDSECIIETAVQEEIGIGDACPVHEGSFQPIVEWTYGDNGGCLSQPIVADINQDGRTDILVNVIGSLSITDRGSMHLIHGDGSGVIWTVAANLAFGSTFAVGDIDNDSAPEIIAIREYQSGILGGSTGIMGPGEYAVVAFENDGTEIWESEHYDKLHFDHATAPILTDMNGDGEVEIVVGKVILRPDGTTRGIGALGRGSYGVTPVPFTDMVATEATVPAVTDLDLDGQQEIIVGDGRYDIDGNTIAYHQPDGIDPWSNTASDGMISIANLDNDPEGEIIAITGNSIRAIDTDGSIMWGPIHFPEPANILATAAIADLDGDGYPDIVTAGGNILRAMDRNGNTMWEKPITDESGATGASIFDFEGDGIPEVVYIDEVQMVAYEGPTGYIKFQSMEHGSNTMFDVPAIADVDGDDQAEIVVCHNGYGKALSVYGDADESWMTARPIWNQHAYHINNIEENLTIPANPLPSFQHSNTWHSAISTPGESILTNLESEFLDICTDDCDTGKIYVTVRIRNRGETDIGAGLGIGVYAQFESGRTQLTTASLPNDLPSGYASESILLEIDAADVAGATSIVVVADDNGSGTSLIQECSERDNEIWIDGPFCQ